jgi:hypothetical protein
MLSKGSVDKLKTILMMGGFGGFEFKNSSELYSRRDL